MTNGSKPGVKTSEFWITLFTQVFSILAGALGWISPELAGSGVLGSQAVYTSARSLTKAKVGA